MSLMRAVVAPLNGDLMQKYGENTVDFLKRRGQVFVHGFFFGIETDRKLPDVDRRFIWKRIRRNKEANFRLFFLKKIRYFSINFQKTLDKKALYRV